jgi:tetratricopeptide (TPR) repeat protein
VARARVRITVVICAVASLAMASLRAGAAPLDPRELEARKDFAEARYEDALHLFADLFAQLGDPIYLRNVARCYQKLKRPAEAIASFQEYLAKAKVAPSEREQIASYISEMEALQASRRSTAGSPGAAVQPAPASAVARPSPRLPAEGREWRTMRWAGVVAGAVGVALVGLGVGFGYAAHAAQKDVEAQYDPARDADGARYERAQWIFYGAGVSALAAGAILFVVGRRAPDSPPTTGLHAQFGLQGVGWETRF